MDTQRYRRRESTSPVLVNLAEVRFVDQKPTLHKVWGIGPEFKSVKALGLENLIPVSV